MKICPYCRQEVLGEDKFCGWCGKKLPGEPSEEERKIVEKIREEARKEDLKRKKIREREREEKMVKLIKERAEEKVKEIEKVKSKREQIIEKLTEVPSGEEERREEFLKMLGMKKKPELKAKMPSPLKIKEKEVIFRPVPVAKPSNFEKIWIRTIILILVLSVLSGILIFGLDILKLKEKPVPPPAGGTTTEGILPPGEKPPEELIIPLSLLQTQESITLEIPSLDKLPLFFSDFLKSGLKEKVFTRILIKNLEENKIVDLEDFLKTIKVTAPASFYQTLKPDFTLFIYSPQTLQIGFIAEIKENKKEELKNLLSSWEKEMQADFEPLFVLFGKEKLMVAHPFIDRIYLGENFRYTTFYQESFGMCYGTLKDRYFIFTTSGETMLRLIEYKAELTKDLKEGDRETEVEILQTWLANDPKIYPEGLVTGNFGALTKKAVVRFQQKFSEDILKPWGLVEGTGIVDKSTREKLNEVYRR